MPTRALNVVITGDAKPFNRMMDQTEHRSHRWAGTLAKGFAAVGVAAAGAAAVGLKKSADAAIEAEKAQATMVAQLKASGIAYKDHAKQIDEVIQKTSRLSGLDDEDLQRSFTNIVRVTGDVNKSLKLTGLAADFARAKHMDVAKAGELVGKVAGGNTGILSRYGIQVGKNATAQQALALLQSKFAGQAEAYGKTTAGALDRAGVASENLGEIVGAKLTPLLAKGATVLVDLIDKSGKLAGPIRTMSGVVKRAFDTISNAFGGGDKDATKFGSNVRQMVGNVVALVKRLWAFTRDTFQGIGGDLRIIGKRWLQFQGVVTDVILFISKRTIPIIEAAIKGLVEIVRGVVKIIAGILSGDFSKVWDGAKLIVKGALRGIVGIIKGVGGLLKDAMVALAKVMLRGLIAGLKALPGALKDALVAAVKAGIRLAKDGIVDAAKGVLGPLGRLIGDGIGKPIGDGIGSLASPGGAVNLMGADPDLLPFASIAGRMGLHTSSGLRVGAITSSGNVSYHSSGDAIDEAGPPGAMMRYFNFMKRTFGPRLRELIYTPGGVGIKDGRPYRYTGQVAADHYDHVHVAYTGPFGDGIGQAAQAARAAGFRGQSLVNAVAVAGPESSYRNAARLVSSVEDSRGMWQINTYAHPWAKRLNLADPFANARAAYRVWREAGGSFRPWTGFTSGGYRSFLDDARRALSGGGGGRGGGHGGGGGVHGAGDVYQGPSMGSYAPDRPGHPKGGFVGTQLDYIEAAGALAELTPTSADDVAVARMLVRYWRRKLRQAKRSGRGPKAIAEAARNLKSAQDALADLTAPADTGGSAGGDTGGGSDSAVADAINALTAEMARRRAFDDNLVKTQGPALVGAVVAAMNGDLGGRIGLGFQGIRSAAGSVAGI